MFLLALFNAFFLLVNYVLHDVSLSLDTIKYTPHFLFFSYLRECGVLDFPESQTKIGSSFRLFFCMYTRVVIFFL